MLGESGHRMPSAAHARQAAGGSDSRSNLAGASDLIVVRSNAALRSMTAYLLLPARVHPVVALTSSLSKTEPVMAPSKIREIVGSEVRVYFIPGEYILRGLEVSLGHQLGVLPGAARLWWPGLSPRSDPGDHPLVLPLADESELDMLAEFARLFDLGLRDGRVSVCAVADRHRAARAGRGARWPAAGARGRRQGMAMQPQAQRPRRTTAALLDTTGRHHRVCWRRQPRPADRALSPGSVWRD